jgi:hypothetical protein
MRSIPTAQSSDENMEHREHGGDPEMHGGFSILLAVRLGENLRSKIHFGPRLKSRKFTGGY